MTHDADLSELAPVHPAFARHFTDPIYLEEAEEFAPFGSDEGWDLLYEWTERRDELADDATVQDILQDSGFEGAAEEIGQPDDPAIPLPDGAVDSATIVVGAGFTLLRLTGRIDADGKAMTLQALDALIDYYDAPPELVKQRKDLAAWEG